MSLLLNRKRVREVTTYFNSEKGLKNIPYGFGVRLIDWFCATDYALEKFFSKKTPILREFISQFQGKYDEKQSTIDFLKTNFLHGWRASCFSNLSDKKYRRKLKMNGFEIFLEQHKKGKGVVLVNAHFGLPSIVMSLIPALGFENFHAIVGENFSSSMKYKLLKKNRTPKLLSFDRGGQSELFKHLFAAKEILDSGGILHTLGDGMHGVANVFTEFLGKPRGFRSSFAELGLISDSPIIPVYAYPGKRGRIHVEFLEAFQQGSEDMEHEERVRLIVDQYSKVLERKWMEHPYFVTGGFMEMYNKQSVNKVN